MDESTDFGHYLLVSSVLSMPMDKLERAVLRIAI